jgi:ADP-heptose:LPS heptosyltransferase
LVIGVAPGGARNAKQDTPTKRWDGAHYAAVLRRLLQEFAEARVVFLGGSGDQADVQRARAGLPASRVIDLVGRTTVAEARATIAACDLFLVNDSALLHVAGSTDTPTIAVFGPTDPRVLAPQRPNVRALWSPARSEACWDERSGRKAPCAVPCCITRVGPDDVVRIACAALARALAR